MSAAAANALRWDARTTPTALVVLCHGVGADATQMEGFVRAWAPTLPHAAFLAPDGLDPFDQYPEGRQWFSLRDRTPAVLEAAARIAAPRLDAIVDAELARLAIPPDRLALAGFSQGAMMVLHAGLRRRPPPAAILAYAGALLEGPTLAAECTGAPAILLVHGQDDAVVPFARGPAAEATLRRLDIPVTTCWRPGLEHDIDAAGLEAGLAQLEMTLP